MTKHKTSLFTKYTHQNPRYFSLYNLSKYKIKRSLFINYFEELNIALSYLEQGNYQDFFKIFELKNNPDLLIDDNFIEILIMIMLYCLSQ